MDDPTRIDRRRHRSKRPNRRLDFPCGGRACPAILWVKALALFLLAAALAAILAKRTGARLVAIREIARAR